MFRIVFTLYCTEIPDSGFRIPGFRVFFLSNVTLDQLSMPYGTPKLFEKKLHHSQSARVIFSFRNYYKQVPQAYFGQPILGQPMYLYFGLAVNIKYVCL